MTFESHALTQGRQPATIVELDLDSCSRIYGTAPCMASLARTNLILQSQTPGVPPWTTSGLSITGATPAAPDGTPTARFLQGSAMAMEKTLRQRLGQAVEAGQPHTASLYCRAGGANLRLKIQHGLDGAYVDVNLSNGQILGRGTLFETGPALVRAQVQRSFGFINNPAITNLWWRVELVFVPTAASLPPELVVQMVQVPTGLTRYPAMPNEGFSVWGVQMRPGEAAGIYTPTGTTSIAGDGDNDAMCFNTFSTCQDPANYAKEVKTYTLIDAVQVPIDVSHAFPCVQAGGVRYTPTQLNPGGNLSIRGKITIRAQDFTHNDGAGPQVPGTLGSVVDKYYRLRSYNPEARGTFFGKLKARNEFYVGRPMRVLEGYLDEPFSLANFRVREFILEEIRGPDRTGRVELYGRDILSLAIDTRAKFPEPSTGTLPRAIGETEAAPVIELPGGDGNQYVANGAKYIRIGKEVLEITASTLNPAGMDSLTLARARGGTVAQGHSSGAAMQHAPHWENAPVIDIIRSLLTNTAGVPERFIPYEEWQAESNVTLQNFNLSAIITKPEGVTTLLREIMEITLIDLWYDDVEAAVKLKLETPFTDVKAVIDDDNEILADTLEIRDFQDKRLTRVLIWYDMANVVESIKDPANFNLAHFEIEIDKEGPNKFNDERVKTIFTRWMTGAHTPQVQLASQRLLQRFGRVPQEIRFGVDAKDASRFVTGDVIDIRTRVLQSPTGLPRVDRWQIIEDTPRRPASQYTYKALAFFLDPITQGPSIIQADRICVDLYVLLGGPPGPVTATVTIPAGVTISGRQDCPAVTTGQLHPDSTITLVNHGTIRGAAGNGGDGGNVVYFTFGSDTEGVPIVGGAFIFANPSTGGGKGGTAIEVTTSTLIIDNTSGTILAGGGGGGGGGTGQLQGDPPHFVILGGSGGGGGAGTDADDTAGAAGTVGGGDPNTLDGVAGSPGTLGAGGAGGRATHPIFMTLPAGGMGGAPGEPGQAGGSLPPRPTEPNTVEPGAPGGAAGAAVQSNGNALTWLGGLNATQVRGPLE